MNNDIDKSILYTDPLTMKSYPAWLVDAVDQLLYKIRHKDIWEIVEFAIKVWEKKNPTEAKKFYKAQEEFRNSRLKDTGASKSNWIRGTVNIPSDISYLLFKFADHKIEDYGKLKFWRDFASRYPGFSAANKI